MSREPLTVNIMEDAEHRSEYLGIQYAWTVGKIWLCSISKLQFDKKKDGEQELNKQTEQLEITCVENVENFREMYIHTCLRDV